jgi:hypothetical protein
MMESKTGLWGRRHLHAGSFQVFFIHLTFLVMSCSNDDPVEITPALPPVAIEGFAKSNSFTAKWNTVPDVSYYELDVSSDDFATFVPGYEGLRVDTLSNATVSSTIRAVKITGLQAEASYQYRVRSVFENSAQAITTSPNSNTISLCTDPAMNASNAVDEMPTAYSLIVGTWEKFSNSATLDSYPFPEPNGMVEDGKSYCKGERDLITFNADSTIEAEFAALLTDFSGTFKIDSAVSIHGPSQYALVVKIPGYFDHDNFIRLNTSTQAFLDLTDDGKFMTLWLYSWDNGLKDLTMSYKRYIKKD